MQGDKNTVEIKGKVLALDIGGSFIKSGLVSGTGVINEIKHVTFYSGADAKTIIRTFTSVIDAGFNAANGQISATGIAIPGPFNYARGISLMTHKYAGIKDVDLVKVLCEAIPDIAGIPLRFRHDANAFLAGEMWCGAGGGIKRALGVVLGTGIGVACCLDGEFLTNELGSPAPEVSVWKRSFRDSIVEDYVSTRALVAKYRLVRPNYDSTCGVKGIAEAAKAGDGEAIRVLAGFGEDLGNVLVPLCETLRPERIIFGGQISNDFALFENPLKAGLCRTDHAAEIVPGCLGSAAALFGAVLEEKRQEYHSA